MGTEQKRDDKISNELEIFYFKSATRSIGYQFLGKWREILNLNWTIMTSVFRSYWSFAVNTDEMTEKKKISKRSWGLKSFRVA